LAAGGGLTLSELGEAVETGADAWPPILAAVKMTPRDFAKAVSAAGRPAYKRAAEFQGIYDAVMEAFGLDHSNLREPE
jgi:hypothetical protein